MIVIDLLLMLLVAYAVGFLYYGLYRNITARFQRRFGPPVWQSFIDSIKFFFKEDSTSHGWMFYLGPIIMTSGAIMTLFFIPFSARVIVFPVFLPMVIFFSYFTLWCWDL